MTSFPLDMLVTLALRLGSVHILGQLHNLASRDKNFRSSLIFCTPSFVVSKGSDSLVLIKSTDILSRKELKGLGRRADGN